MGLIFYKLNEICHIPLVELLNFHNTIRKKMILIVKVIV